MPYGEPLCLDICVPSQTCFAYLNFCLVRPGCLVLFVFPPFSLFGKRRRSVCGRGLEEG